jgi:hypothetical protein
MPAIHSAKTGYGWQRPRRYADSPAITRRSPSPTENCFDKFGRFLGETFVRGIGGEWTNRPYVDDGSAYLGVRFPWTEYTLTIPTMVTSALARRTGEEWAFVYHRKLADRDSASHC